MARRFYSNAAVATTLSVGIGSGDTSLVVVSAAGYPSTPFIIVIDPDTASEEFILVGAKAGTTFSTLTRGFDGSAAAAHLATAIIKHVAIAADFTELWTHKHDLSDGHAVIDPVFMGTSVSTTDTGQVFLAGVAQAVRWLTEFFDTDDFHDNLTNPSRLSVPAGGAGKYLVTAGLFPTSGNATIERVIWVRKNGIVTGPPDYQGDGKTGLIDSNVSTASVALRLHLAGIIVLADGDYIELMYGWALGGGSDSGHQVTGSINLGDRFELTRLGL